MREKIKIASLLLTSSLMWGQSQINVTAPAPPMVNKNQISVSVSGVPGTQQYYYWVVARYPSGNSLASGPAFIKNAPDTLSAGNFVTINWVGVSGALGYDVLRATTPNLPNGTTNLRVGGVGVVGTTVNDITNALGSYTLNTQGSAQVTFFLDNINYTTPQLSLQNLDTGIVSIGGLVTYPTFGFIQNGSQSSTQYNSYAYYVQLPSYNPTGQSVYSSMWYDLGGFPVNALVGSPINTVPFESDTFRFSGMVNSGKQDLVAIYQGTGGGALTGIALYTQNSAFGDAPFMYAANFHVAGCEGFKCNGSTYPDHAPAVMIGVEVDEEIRSVATHGIGVYSVCVNCLATGNSSSFLADSQKSLQIGDPAHKPWTYAYNSAAGGAIHGMQLNPLLDPNENIGAAKSDSQDAQLCAYTDNLNPPTKSCLAMLFTSNQVTQILSPGSRIYLLNDTGNALSTLHSQLFANAYTAVGPTGLTNTDMGEFVSNVGAAGVVNLTLPNTVVAGLYGYFTVLASQTLNISAGANTIQFGNVTGTTLSSNQSGSSVEIYGVSPTAWVVHTALGFWALDGSTIVNTQRDLNWVSNAGGATVATGVDTFFAIGAPSPSTEGTRQWTTPYAITATGLYLYMTTNATGGAGNTVVTLKKNTAATAITFNVPFASLAGTYSDVAHTVTYAAGDRLGIEVNNGTNGSTGGICCWVVTYK